MSETKWTPGPWQIDRGHNSGRACAIRASDHRGVVVWNGLCRSATDGEHNARLIAAAPDLYRELNHLVTLLREQERDGFREIPGLATLNGARAALAKAKGETP